MIENPPTTDFVSGTGPPAIVPSVATMLDCWRCKPPPKIQIPAALASRTTAWAASPTAGQSASGMWSIEPSSNEIKYRGIALPHIPSRAASSTNNAQTTGLRTWPIRGHLQQQWFNKPASIPGATYVNGTLVFNVHNESSRGFGPIDVAPYLVQGVNLIVVEATDNIPVFGANHDFVASMQIQTTVVQSHAPIPTLSPWMLAFLTLTAISIAVPLMRRNT